MRTRTRRTSIVVAIVTILALSSAGPALAAFPQDPPNDPDYASETYLFDHIPPAYVLASDPEGASGMFVDRAWRDYTTGRPDTLIAYIEGGINWHAGDAAELVDRVYINQGELPQPCAGSPCTTVFGGPFSAYDLNGDGTFNVEDYATDPRVSDSNGNGPRDPEDLIVAFSNSTDNDANGYVDDISGWDFYDDQNDPATVDTEYTHANGQMKQAAAETDNGVGGAGICPDCMLLPIKAGAEALDRTDDLAEAWLFAADAGASVIVSVTADLGYSTFMRQAVEDIWRRGIVMVEASNDFNSTDHQGGMWWPHVLPGNGIVADAQGAPSPGEEALTTTFRSRSNYTSWGTHNMFSAATDGGTTSESTPTVGGVAALLLSYGKDAADQSLIDSPLTNAEAIQVLRATSSDIDDPTLPWPGKPGWDLQYGYGRPNVWQAMNAVHDGEIPPVGWIDSPDWYALYDPTTTSTVPVTGHVEASRSPSYTWELQYAPGAEPAEAAFLSAGSGSGTSPFDGSLGSIDLSTIPSSFWSAAYSLSTTKTLETTEQYTVTLRIKVTDASGRVGEERRTIAVHRDSTWKSGFPKRIGRGGEAQPVLVDLKGQGRLAIVFGDTDGYVHAIDSQTGNELSGWPAHTDPTVVAKPHAGIDPGFEPIVSSVAAGDIKGKGKFKVVATSTTGTVYVFNANGQRQQTWTPKPLKKNVVKPLIPRQQLPRERLPARGATAPPVLADLDADGKLDIIQAGWNGFLYAWHFDGTAVPGWPKKVVLPGTFTPPSGYVRVLDHKLVTPPAVADLDGDGSPELVIRSQFTEVTGSGITFAAHGHVFAYHADGTPVPGWPNDFTTAAEYYGSAQEFITEGSSVPAVADVEGDGDDEIAVGGAFGPTYLFDGDGSLRLTYAAGSEIAATFTTSGAFGTFNLVLSYAQPGTDGQSLIDSLLLPGSGNPINNVERAFSAAAGTPHAGFSTKLQGLDFLGGPIIADVTGDGLSEIINGSDSSALHGYAIGGGQAAGFPKFTTGWSLWAPTAGDLDADGDTEIVMLTREGYLFVWNTPGLATGNNEWWHANHDERNTGLYGNDTRPPGVARNPSWATGTFTASITAPGDDWYTGTVTKYVLTFQPSNVTVERPPTGAAGTTRTFGLPAGTTSFTVQAVDDAGNKGRKLTVMPS
jgi:hypothetical protein